MIRTSAEGVEMVFTLLDLLIVVLVMIVTVIWFRSKYIERFYEACKTGELETVEEYLERKQGWLSQLSSKEICVGLMWASSQNMDQIVKRLMTCDIYRQQTSLASCVMCAVKRGHREVVRILTADLRVPVNMTNKQGLSPLQTTEDPDIIQLLQSGQKRRAALQS